MQGASSFPRRGRRRRTWRDPGDADGERRSGSGRRSRCGAAGWLSMDGQWWLRGLRSEQSDDARRRGRALLLGASGRHTTGSRGWGGARMRRTPASLLRNEAAMAGHAPVRPKETERDREVREREEPGEEGEGGDEELQKGRPWSTGARRRASGRQEASGAGHPRAWGGSGRGQHEQRSRPETDEAGGDSFVRLIKAETRPCGRK